MELNKTEILTEALKHRDNEVLMHQINIDNYRLALQEIEEKYAGSEAMREFADQLRGLLSASIVEQTKEIIMRDVIAKQLEVVQ